MCGNTLLSQEEATQGDTIAMAMYAVGIIPLIRKVSCDVKQVWYADDVTAAGKLKSLRKWWNNLQFGCRFWLLRNPLQDFPDCQRTPPGRLFQNTNICITTEGKQHLEAALAFIHRYVQRKVQQWIEEVSAIAHTQPHAAYSAFIPGLSSKWTYISRTIPDI